ncbi:glycosyltransferase family 4 protein [Dongshaea marina]|uniref:glycosyltransferase family 4 protein n=1 Tax=Dongshaea marina TaxID=2047966 RepID=UPI000D3E1E98|nr:glycosyltransferase family 4 protein [Dongshaea marina]
MRILHLLAQRPGRTGSGVFLTELLRAGATRGYQQAVLAGIPSSQTHSEIDILDEQNFFPVYFESEALPFPVVGMSDVMPYPSTRYRDLGEGQYQQYRRAFSLGLQQAVEQFQPDLIVSHHLWLLTALAKELFPEIPVLGQCHGTCLRQAELTPRFIPYVRQHLQQCEQLFALNPVQRERIIELFEVAPERVHVCGSGYDPLQFYPSTEPRQALDKLRAVYIGKLSQAKGVPSLLKALEASSLDPETFELTLIGNGTGVEGEGIKQSFNQMRHTPNYLGVVEQSVLVKTLQQADIFILPSFYEGLPLVVVEALACGARVVVTELPGLRDYLGEQATEQGLVSFVPLPEMDGVDTPKADALPGFEFELARAIEKMVAVHQARGRPGADQLELLLEDKSWQGLWQRMESYFPEVALPERAP